MGITGVVVLCRSDRRRCTSSHRKHWKIADAWCSTYLGVVQAGQEGWVGAERQVEWDSYRWAVWKWQ